MHCFISDTLKIIKKQKKQNKQTQWLQNICKSVVSSNKTEEKLTELIF